MKSKLLQRLAKLPGINWFNNKEKIERTAPRPVNRIQPKETDSQKRLYILADRYLRKLTVQDLYINEVNKLLDQFNFEVEKWDQIQAGHEQEIERIRKECSDLISNSSVALLKQKVQQLEAQVTRLTNHNKNLENRKPILSDHKAKDFINAIDRMLDSIKYNGNRDVGRVRDMGYRLQSLLNKIEK